METGTLIPLNQAVLFDLIIADFDASEVQRNSNCIQK